MNIKTILYWLMTALIIYLLWPLLKWLILIVVGLLIFLYFYLKHKTKVFTSNIKWDDDFDNNDNNYYETYDNKVNDDVIDVEYTTKDEEEIKK